jgi:hypothetical protein
MGTNRKRVQKPRPPLSEFFISKSEPTEVQELRIAEDIGGRRTPCSGALSGAKGDVESKKFLVDAKRTDKRSFVLSERVLAKVDKEALAYGKIPALVVRFTNFRFGVTNEWAVIPYPVFVRIAEHLTKEEGRKA